MEPIIIMDKRIEKVNLHIASAKGIYDTGYQVRCAASFNGKIIEFTCGSFLATIEQDEKWCKNQCQKIIDSIEDTLTPGQIYHLAHSFKPLDALGIPTPPQQPHLIFSDPDAIKFHKKTNLPIMNYYNSLYQNWACEYNKWQRGNPELAVYYGCNVQDENLMPVQ